MQLQTILADFRAEFRVTSGHVTDVQLGDVDPDIPLEYSGATIAHQQNLAEINHDSVKDDSTITAGRQDDKVNSAGSSVAHEVHEPAIYLKHFVRKSGRLTYAWFEIVSPNTISEPPAFLTFEPIQVGDLFIHRNGANISFWVRAQSPSQLPHWQPIVIGESGTLNEDLAQRILTLLPDGTPSWLLPATLESSATHAQDGSRFMPHTGWWGALGQELSRGGSLRMLVNLPMGLVRLRDCKLTRVPPPKEALTMMISPSTTGPSSGTRANTLTAYLALTVKTQGAPTTRSSSYPDKRRQPRHPSDQPPPRTRR
ncbi:hypothetical protein BJ138DRAFT_1105806 [Hygrophoropsis aurantiaca]|uniref:Uncharacterized protein n=1 Tax=Hygrophoropsis aurantiaca TaxID=72124 RepID=A0ACB7ZWZ4_9AGAM|nr:hypothetical protein BJ138DRAFT_1105806 [Hygrophoropsis aurantiaca]